MTIKVNNVLETGRVRGKTASKSISEDMTDAFSKTIGSSRLWPQASDFDLLVGFRNAPTSARGNDMLKELLRRHRNMFRKACWGHVQNYGLSFEDLMQHAYVGAITAYNRYDLSMKNRIKVSSWVQTTVEHYLLDMINREAVIPIPCYMRAMRSYLSGRYDNKPEKKAAFEAKHNIRGEEDRERLLSRYSLLRPEFHSLDQPVPSNDAAGVAQEGVIGQNIVHQRVESIEENLIQRLDLEMLMRRLTPRQRKVCELCMEQEFTVAEAAQILTQEMGQEVTKTMVRSDLQQARQTMRNTF